MSRIRQYLRSLGPSGAVANAGRRQADREREDLAIRRLERVVRVADSPARGAARGAPRRAA